MRLMGPILSPPRIERAICDLLTPERGLLRLYLDEVMRQDTAGMPETDFDRLLLPKTVRVRERIRNLPNESLPALIIVAPGGERLKRSGGGVYSCRIPVGIAAVVNTGTEELGREKASVQAQAAASLLLQCLPKVDDRVSRVEWNTWDTIDTNDEKARSIHICVHQITLDLDDFMSDTGVPNIEFDIDPGETDQVVDPGNQLTVAQATFSFTLGERND